jgi:hypothetical protein
LALHASQVSALELRCGEERGSAAPALPVPGPGADLLEDPRGQQVVRSQPVPGGARSIQTAANVSAIAFSIAPEALVP